MALIEMYNNKEIKELIKMEIAKQLDFIYVELRKLRESISDLENIKFKKPTINENL